MTRWTLARASSFSSRLLTCVLTVLSVSARGTREAPGRNVRQKAGLNRGVHAAGWGRLVQRLEHKAPGRVQKINPRHTSQTCNACRHRAAESRERQSRFRCVACGHQAHADVNAAKNPHLQAGLLAVSEIISVLQSSCGIICV